jgi:hypothetical protein
MIEASTTQLGTDMSKEFEALLGQYWDLAYLEGKSGVSQGDKANEVLRALKKLAEQPAQQEPLGYIATMALNDLQASIYRDVTVYSEDLEDTVAIYTNPQPPAQPLTPDFEADTGYSRDERAAFTAGWEAAEAAHGITKGNT